MRVKLIGVSNAGRKCEKIARRFSRGVGGTRAAASPNKPAPDQARRLKAVELFCAETPVDAEGQTIGIADAHRGEGKHCIVKN